MTEFKIDGAGWYVMRNGEKREIVGKSMQIAMFPWIALSAGDFGSVLYKEDGSLLNDMGCHPQDIVAKYVEPRKVKVDAWMNVYEDGGLGIACGKADADQDAFHYTNYNVTKRIACIHIEREVTEGEGL